MYSRVKSLAFASCLLVVPVALSQADGLLQSLPSVPVVSNALATSGNALGNIGIASQVAPVTSALASVGNAALGNPGAISLGAAGAHALGLPSIEHSTAKLGDVKHKTLAMGDKPHKVLKDKKKSHKSLKGKKPHKSMKWHKFDKKKNYKPHKKPHKKWHKKPHTKHYPDAPVLASGALSVCGWNYDRDLQYVIYSCDPRRQQ